MALQPKIVLSGISADAGYFMLQDTTGNYSVTNPGGYGAPNLLRGDITALLIVLYNSGSPINKLFYRPSAVTNFIDGTTTQQIAVANFNGLGKFSDGVINIDYIPLRSFIVTVNNLVVASAGLFKGDEDVVVINNIVYSVDKTVTNTASSLTLTTQPPVGTTTVQAGYKGFQNILNTKGLESSLAKAIAKNADSCGCNCNDNNVIKLTNILLKKIGAEVRFNCSDFIGAQNLVDTANNNLMKGCRTC